MCKTFPLTMITVTIQTKVPAGRDRAMTYAVEQTSVKPVKELALLMTIAPVRSFASSALLMMKFPDVRALIPSSEIQKESATWHSKVKHLSVRIPAVRTPTSVARILTAAAVAKEIVTRMLTALENQVSSVTIDPKQSLAKFQDVLRKNSAQTTETITAST